MLLLGITKKNPNYLNFSNQAKVCATFVIKLLGLAAIPCDASGISTNTVSILRNFKA